jgi:Tfp pilus assembly protein PilO
MPNSSRAELYFIAAMMILILIMCAVSVFFFVKTYKKEMKAREWRKAEKEKLRDQKSEIQN